MRTKGKVLSLEITILQIEAVLLNKWISGVAHNFPTFQSAL